MNYTETSHVSLILGAGVPEKQDVGMGGERES